MFTRTPFVLTVTCSTVVAATVPTVARADNPAPRLERFTATHDGTKLGPDFHDPFAPRQLWSGVRKGKDGVWRAVGLQVTYYAKKGVIGERDRNTYVSYPPMKSGDVMPAFDRLYRVTPLPPDRRDKKQVVRFDWVGGEFAGGALNLTPTSIPVPLAQGKEGYGRFAYHMFRVTAIGAGKGGRPVASLQVDGDATAQVRAGDVVAVPYWHPVIKDGPPSGESAFRVLSVVPPDPKTGVIGWVEFDPEPLAEADLKAKKFTGRVVRPSKPGAGA